MQRAGYTHCHISFIIPLLLKFFAESYKIKKIKNHNDMWCIASAACNRYKMLFLVKYRRHLFLRKIYNKEILRETHTCAKKILNKRMNDSESVELQMAFKIYAGLIFKIILLFDVMHSDGKMHFCIYMSALFIQTRIKRVKEQKALLLVVKENVGKLLCVYMHLLVGLNVTQVNQSFSLYADFRNA